VCCVIVVLLCLTVFELLKIREIRKSWTGFGDVEASVGMRSICKTWASGSTRESTCVVRILDLLFLATPSFCNYVSNYMSIKKYS